MSKTEHLLISLQDNVLTITLNHAKVNAINRQMTNTLLTALKQAENDSQVRCLLLTGSGNIFSAGQDLMDFDASGEAPFRQHLLHTFNPLVLQLRSLEKPVLAAINGVVAGAALGLVLACDLRISSDQARFVTGFAGIGLAPDSAVSLLLPTLIGLGRAIEFAWTNESITPEQALAWGLVNRVVPDSELPEQSAAWARQLAQGPVRAMGLAKREFNKAVLGNLEKVLDYETHVQEIAGQGAEHAEGVHAFLEKRKPHFRELAPKE